MQDSEENASSSAALLLSTLKNGGIAGHRRLGAQETKDTGVSSHSDHSNQRKETDLVIVDF